MEVVYGGCFNPPTIAHQEIISYLANHYDKVILIPTGNDYNKVGLTMLSYQQLNLKRNLMVLFKV